MPPLRIDVICGTALTASLQRQIEQQRAWRALPPGGIKVDFYGRDLWVFPGVFPPGDDTYQLAESHGSYSDKTILDFGTGTGAIAVYAASQGALRVDAIDINPTAVANARANAEMWSVSNRMTVYLSDGLFTANPGVKLSYSPEIGQ